MDKTETTLEAEKPGGYVVLENCEEEFQEESTKICFVIASLQDDAQ